ncbi:hypothetical protein K435DRAFT_857143 [Dendrothele bispora CBS 962.96]|uniref:DUF6532 domain-containing protein n=1 Tax=Dendrothele bispora (strain CBS 962.96) TaxID=1314807 RepID=A0A4V4HG94_DENBC|nr:hypothetical protein K435DRAFT_857143 [Dendrothele bispora CBS 962.96]
MEALRSRLSKNNDQVQASPAPVTDSDRPRAPRKAAQTALENSIWYDAQHKKRPPGPNTTRKPKKGKSANKESASANRGRKSLAKSYDKNGGSKSTQTSGATSDEAEEDAPQLEPKDFFVQSKNTQNGDDGSELDNDCDAFIPPSQSRASSVSLPPAIGFDEDDDSSDEEVVVSGKRRAVHLVQSDDEEGSVPKKSRNEKFMDERPIVISTDATSANLSSSSSRNKKEKAPGREQHQPTVWPLVTEYTPVAQGSRILSKSAQKEPFRTILEKASVNAIGLFLFDTTYPDNTKQNELLIDSLILAATELKQPDIVQRLTDVAETSYRKPLQAYVFNRVVHMRGDVRKTATTAVVSSYPLTDKECDVAAFIKFIQKKCRYIYPQEFPLRQGVSDDRHIVAVGAGCDLDDTQGSRVPAHASPSSATVTSMTKHKTYLDAKSLKMSLPYRHPAIIIVLRSFFMGAASPGYVYRDLFVSSIPGNKEKEVPKSMVAFAAAVVHFCLGEWTGGSRLANQNFTANGLRAEYNRNIDLLQQIASDPRKYHRLMADLYQRAISDDHGDESDDGASIINLNDLSE